MSEMVVCVARALWEHSRKGVLYYGDGTPIPLDPDILHPLSDWNDANFRINWYLQAEAAIRAMREPTKAMKQAAIDGCLRECADHAWNPDAGQVWQAMIDEALK